MVNSISSKFTVEELKARAFYRIAWCIKHMWDETAHSDTRLLQEPLIPYKFVHVGNSKKGDDYNEHVIPRVLICYKSHEMFAEGESIEGVANMIARTLKIVRISNEEQRYLDYELKLKERMPDEWDWETGDIYARLKAANIEFDFLK